MEMYLLEICLIPVSLNCVQPNSNSGWTELWQKHIKACYFHCEIASELCAVCPLSQYLRAAGLFLNSNDTTGTTQLHSLCLTFTNLVLNIWFFPPHTTLGNFNHSTTEWLHGMIIIFQTFGSFYYPIGSTLRTHWGDDVPSVSHVGSNQMRVLTLTISREKTFASGELWSTCRLCEQWAGL